MKTGRMHVWIIFFQLVLLATPGWSQKDYPWLRSGDELYQRGAYSDAETAYRKALVDKDRPTTSYNLGNSMYQQNRIPEAIQQYQKSISSLEDPQLKSQAYFNMGNAYFQQQNFKESIQAYKEALKLQPQDEDARENLMLAMRQWQQQQKQQQEQQQKQDEQPRDNNTPQPSSGEQNPGQDKTQQDAQKPQNESSPPPPENLSEEEARDILKAIEREDQRVQEKLKKASASKSPPVKDW